MNDDPLVVREFSRSFDFEDITIRSDGDGRTVEAYAAVFDTPAEVRDHDGHYFETLSRTSFDKTIQERGTNFGVFYNHAMTLHGTPDGNLSVPIGVPLEVSRDDRGVFTATRYLDNPLADSVLDGIKQRAIRGQSFTGRTIKSMRQRAQKRGELPTIIRNEIAMREYGPTVFPVYKEAAILATRSNMSFLDELAGLDPADLDRFRSLLGLATPQEPAEAVGTSDLEAARAEIEPQMHSARQTQLAFARLVRERNLR